jgi:ADP-dependent NAD(P)H-hydrate dehydratase / NAD(P)H-hydrate epimerase
MKIVSARKMQDLDRAAIHDFGIPGSVLMENAGRGTYENIVETVPDAAGRPIAVLCGRGNNGGDGLVIARCFHNDGARVTAFLFADAGKVAGDALTNLEAFKEAGGRLIQITDEAQWMQYAPGIQQASIIIDALLGTGLSSEVRGLYHSAIESINAASGATVVAVDIPSGIDATTGAVLGAAVKAHFTCTFGLAKKGLVIHPGAQYAGRLEIIDIGIPAELVESSDINEYLLDGDMLAGIVPVRKPDSHKGTYGHGFIIAGSPGKTGAAAMCAQAAMRAGAGLVTVGVPASLNPILEAKLSEPMTEPLPEEAGGFLGTLSLPRITELLQGKSVVAIGPGMGDHTKTSVLMSWIIEAAAVPLVIDADGLNILARNVGALSRLRVPAVLTPHPGEMARLTGLPAQAVQADRIGCARKFAQQYNVIVALKGSRTVIAAPGGSIYVNPTGNPGMASGGMGDALTGLITGLIAQGIDPLKATLLAVYIHGMIGDDIARERAPLGILATDIIERIPTALARFVG